MLPSAPLIFIISQILGLTGYRKQVIKNNLKSTIGSSLSQKDQKTFHRKCHAYIARVILETLKFQKNDADKIAFQNLQKLEDQCINKNGLILLASHYGNWELACINLPKRIKVPCYGVYKPLKNKTFDAKLKELRAILGLNLIPMNTIARTIARNNDIGQPAIYILISDQNPRSAQNVEWIDFLGVKSAFTKGALKFQKKYNFPVAYMQINPLNNFFEYLINIEFPTDEESKEINTWYSRALEQQIRQAPQYWLWSHKRWKRKYKEDISKKGNSEVSQ